MFYTVPIYQFKKFRYVLQDSKVLIQTLNRDSFICVSHAFCISALAVPQILYICNAIARC